MLLLLEGRLEGGLLLLKVHLLLGCRRMLQRGRMGLGMLLRWVLRGLGLLLLLVRL